MRTPYPVRETTPKSDSNRKPHVCTHCGQPATKEALFRGDGLTLVEKYCDACLKGERFTLIMAFYEGD